MKIKVLKVLAAILVFVSVLTASFSAFAKNAAVEGVFVNKPSLTFVVKGNAKKDDIKNVKINDDEINISDAKKYSAKNSKVAVYIAVDISGSMKNGNSDFIQPLKNSLVSYVKTFGKDDKVALYSMGDKTNKLLKGSESTAKRESTIVALKSTNQNSYLCSSLKKIYEDASKDYGYDRRLVICISDGDDVSKKVTYETIKSQYKSHSLPLYSLVLQSGSSNTEDVKAFKEVNDLSGGSYFEYNSGNAQVQFKKLEGKINNATVFSGEYANKSNAVDKEKEKNVFYFNNSTVEYISVASNNSDSSAPEISGDIKYDKEKKVFTIEFSENIIVDESKVSIKRNDKTVKISKIKSSKNVLTIDPKDEIYSGEYEFDLSGVTDNSNEKNQLAKTKLTQIIEGTSVAVKILKNFWWVCLPVLFLIALYIVLIAVKKKKNVKTIREIFETQIEEETIEERHTQVVKQHMYAAQKQDSAHLSMYIEVEGTRQKVDLDVISSAFVGRSSECDICIEDAKLSRQHFVIEVINGSFAITDLNTTNGTFVNGIRVDSRQLVKPGDKISAGCCKFIIL